MQTKEQIADKQRVYREANKEQLSAKAKVHYIANKEELKARAKSYYDANKEQVVARQKVYDEAHKEKKAAKNRAYHEANKEEISAKNRAKHAERNLMLFNYKGAKCCHCGLHEPDRLEIYDYHHIDPATKLHGVSNILTGPIERLMTEVDKCLLLCSNCHRTEHARLNKEKLCRIDT